MQKIKDALVKVDYTATRDGDGGIVLDMTIAHVHASLTLGVGEDRRLHALFGVESFMVGRL